MAILVSDDTARTSSRPDTRIWRTDGGSSPDPTENNGYINFEALQNGQSRHLIVIRDAWDEQGILLTVKRPTSTGSNRLRLWLSHSGVISTVNSEYPTNGIAVTSTESGAVTMQQIINSASTTISPAAVSGKIPTNVDTRIRAERVTVSGSKRIRAKIWLASDAEPTAWDLDVADDGTVPKGVVAIGCQRTTTSVWRVADIDVYAGPGLYPTTKRASRLRKYSGRRLPFGRHAAVRSDSGFDQALPSWLTGTVTTVEETGVRTLTAAANSTSELRGKPQQAEAHILTVYNSRLNADTQAGMSIGFTDGTNVWELKQVPTVTTPSLNGGGQSLACPYYIRNDGEGPRHRNLTLMLIPAKQQLIALEGDWLEGQVLGWLNLTSVPSRTTPLTPVITAIAGTAQSTLGFTGVSVEVHRL